MAESNTEQTPLLELSRKQRRVLGVLLEKAFTTPEQYPLTLKGTTTGCNQKSNRDPVTNYDEDTVLQTLQELVAKGLVGILHTESGRTERYRHYLRHRTQLSERQLAILTELMLRGKQRLGELRTRASRMVAIDTAEQLRLELAGLMDLGLVRASGPLARRGIEVDHNLYPPGENREPLSTHTDDSAADADSLPHAAESDEPPGDAPHQSRLAALEAQVERLEQEIGALRQRMDSLDDELARWKRDLGC
jgi:hypothetical protein